MVEHIGNALCRVWESIAKGLDMAEKKKSIGALWLREARSGSKFMSGKVEVNGQSMDIVVFKNMYKEEDKHPDYRIFESEPREPKPQNNAIDQAASEDIPF